MITGAVHGYAIFRKGIGLSAERVEGMKNILLALVLLLLGLFLFLFWLAFFSSRPPLTTDPATLAGDGSVINYCELPVLDGSGKVVDENEKPPTIDQLLKLLEDPDNPQSNFLDDVPAVLTLGDDSARRDEQV